MVSRKTANITKRSCFGAYFITFKSFVSIISQPTLKSTAASALNGILFAKSCPNRIIAARKQVQNTAQSFDVPPALIAAAERMVAPEPGIAPKSEHIRFPMPCDITILLLLQLVFVRESTTRFVKRLSDEHTTAIISAGIMRVLMLEKSAVIICGRFEVTPCTTGKSIPQHIVIIVHTTRAKICAGMIFVITLGVHIINARVNIPATRAFSLILPSDAARLSSAKEGVARDFAPKNGLSCKIIKITPTAFIKPEITG